MFGAGPPRIPMDRHPSPEQVGAVLDLVSADRLRRDVERLPAPRSRLHAPQAMRRTDELICESLNGQGWQAELRAFDLKQATSSPDVGTLRDDQRGPAVYAGVDGRNVVAVNEGRRADAVIVGAHHDTVRDSPGADDNGAGVAALLELARVLPRADFDDTIMLVAFDMEELGLLGSRAFVAEQLGGRPVRAAIIYETVAYTDHRPGAQMIPPGLGMIYGPQVRRVRKRELRGDWTAILYQNTSLEAATTLAACLQAVQGNHAAQLLRDPLDLPFVSGLLARVAPFVKDFARSDHFSFWQANLPAVMLTDTANFRNPHYHQPTDTPATLDYAHLRGIVAATALALDRLAKSQRCAPAT